MSSCSTSGTSRPASLRCSPLLLSHSLELLLLKEGCSLNHSGETSECGAQLAGIRDGLKTEVGDLHEALRGEQDARAAATEELEARLAAKERAEEDCEAAESKYLQLERQFLAKVDEVVRVQETANAEVRCFVTPAHLCFAHNGSARRTNVGAPHVALYRHSINAKNGAGHTDSWEARKLACHPCASVSQPLQFTKYKDMQAALQAEKALWEEQQGIIPKPPAAGFARAGYNIGNMFGSFRNAVLAGAASQAGGMEGTTEAAIDAAAVVALPPDMPASRLPVRP